MAQRLRMLPAPTGGSQHPYPGKLPTTLVAPAPGAQILSSGLREHKQALTHNIAKINN